MGRVIRHEALIERIYEAAWDKEAWAAVGAELTFMTGSCASVQLLRNRTTGATDVVGGCRYDADLAPEYEAHYHSTDLWAAALKGMPMGQMAPMQAHVPEKTFAESEFYNDFLRRSQAHTYWAAAIQFRIDDRHDMNFYLLRGRQRAEFTPAELVPIAPFMPHVARAHRLKHRLLLAEHARDDLMAALDKLAMAVLLVGGDSRLLHANGMGSLLLAKNGPFSLDRAGRLTANSAAQTASLRAAVAIESQRLPEHGRQWVKIRDGNNTDFIVELAPLQTRSVTEIRNDSVALFVTDVAGGLQLHAERIRSMLGLTMAETRLALLVGEGLGVADAARKLGVSYNTARSQMRAIFAKTGTHRQADLARKLRGLSGAQQGNFSSR